MTDYIDRQMAIKEAHTVVIDGDVYDVVQVETLMGLSSADVPPVVRCKDCEHCDPIDKFFCYIWGCRVRGDGFCSYGEEKEG